MAIDTFVAGPYSAAYNSADQGITEDGYTLQQEFSAQDVSPSDAYGDTVLDAIYRGGNVFLQYMSKAYKAGTIAAMWPWGTLGNVGTVGKMMIGGSLVQAMVLTRRVSDSTPTTITGSRSHLARNFPVSLLFDSRLRTVPIRMQLLPSDAGAFFTTA